MTTYTYTHTIPTSAQTHTTWTDNDSDHWSDIITTPTPSTVSSSIQFKSASWHPHPHEHEPDHNPKYDYTPKQRYSAMEESWRDYPLPASPLTDLSSGIAPHGLGGHRRGPSELESTVLWDTSQTNGELGLAPHIQMERDMKAGFPGPGPDSGSLPVTMSIRKQPQSTSTPASIPTPSGQLPLPIAVWATIMDSSKGRDKVLVRHSHLTPYIYADGRIEMRSIYVTYLPISLINHSGRSTIITLVTI
jgi:hypothetical protein